MKSHFLAIHPLIGTKSKPAPLHLQQRSVFYWWWAYLKRNSEYLQSCEAEGKGVLAALYADFGDVRGDEFRSWWGGSFQRGAYLFAERQSDLTVKTIDGQASISTALRIIDGFTSMYFCVTARDR